MVQGRGGTRLALEAFQCGMVFGVLVGQKLQRDVPAQARVFGFIDDTHTAAAELVKNAVMRDSVAGHPFASVSNLSGILHPSTLGGSQLSIPATRDMARCRLTRWTYQPRAQFRR